MASRSGQAQRRILPCPQTASTPLAISLANSPRPSINKVCEWDFITPAGTTGHSFQIMAEYYQAVPDGVIDDRFGVKHSDFISPEYQTLEKINPKKWEECRGLGRSFGYNRAEGEAETIAPDELIYLLVDIVSKNGNLLLDVGPEADGTIPD